jgi:hypothetical protein
LEKKYIIRKIIKKKKSTRTYQKMEGGEKATTINEESNFNVFQKGKKL